MRELIPGRRKDGVVLGDVSMDGGTLCGTVDEYVVGIQDLASDLLNGLGNGGREHESLSLRGRRHHLHDAFDIFPETQIQQCIGFVEYDLRKGLSTYDGRNSRRITYQRRIVEGTLERWFARQEITEAARGCDHDITAFGHPSSRLLVFAGPSDE